MARSLQEQLDSVDSLIADLETRRTAQLSAKGLNRVDKELAPLYAERARLQQQIDSTAGNVGGSIASVCRIDRPS